jgi:hypothetical protein
MSSPSPWNQRALFSEGRGDDDTKNHWATPPEVFDPLHAEFGFHLDAAATLDTCKVVDLEEGKFRYIGPDHEWDSQRDAFEVDWVEASQGRPVWLNPPYGRGIDRWMALARHWGERVPVCVLVFARTDTRWWWDSVFARDRRGIRQGNPVLPGAAKMCAAEVRFKPGRIKFIDPATKKPGDAAPAPSALVVYRPDYTGNWPQLAVL